MTLAQHMKRTLQTPSIAFSFFCCFLVGQITNGQELSQVGQQLQQLSKSFDGFECRYTLKFHSNDDITIGKTVVFPNGRAINYQAKMHEKVRADTNTLIEFEAFDGITLINSDYVAGIQKVNGHWSLLNCQTMENFDATVSLFVKSPFCIFGTQQTIWSMLASDEWESSVEGNDNKNLVLKIKPTDAASATTKGFLALEITLVDGVPQKTNGKYKGGQGDFVYTYNPPGQSFDSGRLRQIDSPIFQCEFFDYRPVQDENDSMLRLAYYQLPEPPWVTKSNWKWWRNVLFSSGVIFVCVIAISFRVISRRRAK